MTGGAPIDERRRTARRRHRLTKKARQKMMLARAEAIDRYAGLEAALGILFATLLGVPQEISDLVFYRIVSTSARNGILRALIKERDKEAHQKFVTSLFALIRDIDDERNAAVHWHQYLLLGESFSELRLRPRRLPAINEASPSMGAEELKKFTDKAAFATQLVIGFRTLVQGRFESPLPEPWRGIFRRRVVYPSKALQPLQE